MKEALVHVRLELTTLALSERGADNAKVVSSNLTWTKAVSVFCSEGMWSLNFLSRPVSLVGVILASYSTFISFHSTTTGLRTAVAVHFTGCP